MHKLIHYFGCLYQSVGL